MCSCPIAPRLQPGAAPYDLPEWDLDLEDLEDDAPAPSVAFPTLALGAMSKMAMFQRTVGDKKLRSASYETGSTAASDPA